MWRKLIFQVSFQANCSYFVVLNFEVIPPGRVPAPQDRLPSYLLYLEMRLPTVRSARAPEGAPVISQVGSRLPAARMVDFVDELGMGGSEKAEKALDEEG